MNAFFRRLNSTKPNIVSDTGHLIIRVCFGLLLAYHGYGKLSSFSEYASQFSDPFGIGSKASLILVIFAEFFCGLFIAMGLFTRLAAIPVIITFAIIFFSIHGNDPFGNKELPAAYLALSIGIFLGGSGRLSLDRWLKF